MLGPEMLGFLVLFGFDFSRFSLFCVLFFHHFLFCLFVVVEKKEKTVQVYNMYWLATQLSMAEALTLGIFLWGWGGGVVRECAGKIF